MQTLAPLKSRKIPKKSKEFRCESQRARELEEANKGAAPSEEYGASQGELKIAFGGL